MEILKHGEFVTITKEGDLVRKTWLCPESNPLFQYKSREVMFYTLAQGVPGIAHMVEHGDDFIVLKYYPKNFHDHIMTASPAKKFEMGKRLAFTIFELFKRGICHADINPGNVLSDEDLVGPILVDPEFDHVPPGTPFSKSFDMFGTPPLPLSWQGKRAPPVCYKNSIGELLGLSSERAHDLVVEDLKSRIIACSGSEIGPDFKDLGYAYSSYDMPLFSLRGWRNTRARMEVLEGIIFSGKSVLDLGAGTGTMLLNAALLGASGVGVEINEDRVGVANDLATYLGLANKVRFVHGDPFSAGPQGLADIIKKTTKESQFDVVLFLSLMGRIQNGSEYLPEIRKMCRTLVLETNHVGDRLPLHFEEQLRMAGFSEVQFLGKVLLKRGCDNPIRYAFVADTREFVEWP